MYVDKVDELIDNILNMFYDVWKNNKIKIKENKFRDQGDKINEMILEFIDSIKLKDLEVVGKNNVNFLKETLIRYLCYYVYISIYSNINDEEIFVKELIEITKNAQQNKTKIKNFYNSTNNSLLIKLTMLLSGILVIVDVTDAEKMYKIVKSNPIKYDPVIEFLNDVGNDLVQKLFIKTNPNQIHNIIKTIIFKQIYINQEKKDFLLFIESGDQAEYKYITIVVPRTDYIDFASIENILIKEFPTETIEDVYNMMMDYDDIISTPIKVDYKINKLFEKKIVVPIVEDFLRYHKYDKDTYSVDKIDSKERTSRQDNTKLKYIVTKMNDIVDYHSIKDEKKKKEIEKYCYGPLKDRKAILINEYEEEKIIEKMILQGTNIMENIPDYEDLREFRQYAYINFRDMKKDGFTFKPEKTIEAIRDVNIDNLKTFKGLRYIQNRIGNKNIGLNIVGLAIPNNISQSCMTLDMLDEIKGNGYDETFKIIQRNFTDKNNIYGKNKSGKVYYWLFDVKKDKIESETFKNISRVNSNEYCKIMMEKLYDDLLVLQTNKIYSYIRSQKIVTLQMIKRVMDSYNKNLLIVPEGKLLYDLYNALLDKVIEGDYSYDKNENIIPGINKELIELPSIKEEKVKDSIIRIKKVEEEIKEDEIELIDAVCLHNYEWDNMSYFRYKNPNKFNQLFFEFFKKYGLFTTDKQFVCKSCSVVLDIQKYVTEYQGGNVEEITISLAAERELENLPEYEKFTRAIKNIDKIISKIAGISNLYYYVGTEPIVKLRRQNVIKQVIDTITTMSPVLKEKNKNRARGEHSGKIYGISKDLSYVFGFDLDNEIFVYSSQEVDKFKLMKYNNILVYILFTIIFELNNIDVLAMIDQKVCNFILFEKHGFNLFDKILIRNNNSDGLTYIQDYKILCYVIFYVSCMMSRYNMWFNLSKETQVMDKKNQINPLVQKMIIHTLIDMMNIILEVNTQKEKNFIIEVISTKFLIKLRTLFNDTKLYEKLKMLATKNIYLDDQTKKIKYVEKQIPNIPISKEIKFYSSDLIRPRNLKLPKIKILKRDYIIVNPIKELTLLTNCESGPFHSWNYKLDLTCNNCKKTMNELLKEKHKDMKQSYMKNKIKSLAIKFCPDGKTHQFDPITNICKLCKKTYSSDIGNTYTETELNNMIRALSVRRIKENKIVYDKLEERKKLLNKTDNLLLKLKSIYDKKYNNMTSTEKIIRQFVDILSGIVGETITINNKIIHLYNNTYIFNHDQYGNQLKDPIVLFEKDILFKREDNRNTIQYKVKGKNMTVLYDAINMNLIGYREGDKDIVRYPIDRNDRFIIIHLSILNKLKYCGFNSLFLDIEDKLEKYSYLKDDKKINNKVLIELLRTRLLNIKNIFSEIHRLIYQIVNKFTGVDINRVLKKYNKIFKFINTVDLEGNGLFKDWKYINDTIYINNTKENIPIHKNINNKNKYVNINDLVNIENTDKQIIFYFVTELVKLISFNEDKYTRTNLGYMLAEIIENVYETHFTNTFDNDIQKFNYILTVSPYYTDESTLVNFGLDDNFNVVTEEEAEKQKELADIGLEEVEALDVDVDSEDVNEDFADNEVQYEGPDVGENNESYELLGY